MPVRGDDTSPIVATHWVIPLRAVAIVGGVFGFSCLGVLVVVTAIDGDNALSTVALALAILAFSVQLIVFVAQQSLSTEAARRSEELYGSMQGVLAELREKAEGTQADVRVINERMLEAILSKNLAQSPVALDYGQIASQVANQAARAEEVVESPSAEFEQGFLWPPRQPSPDDEKYVRMLQTYPAEDEVGDALEILEGLAPPDRIFLKGFGNDEINARRPGSSFDPSWPMDAARGLLPYGLVEPLPSQGLEIGHLTDKGREVARLLTAEGEPPAYLPNLEKIRQDLDT